LIQAPKAGRISISKVGTSPSLKGIGVPLQSFGHAFSSHYNPLRPGLHLQTGSILTTLSHNEKVFGLYSQYCVSLLQGGSQLTILQSFPINPLSHKHLKSGGPVQFP